MSIYRIDVDDLANEIRRVDGNHTMGAGALAEALAPWLAAHDREDPTEVEVEAAARAIATKEGRLWEVVSEDDRLWYRSYAKTALLAARDARRPER